MRYRRTVLFASKALANHVKRLIDVTEGESLNGVPTGMQRGFIHYIWDHNDTEDVFQRDLESVFNIRRSTATGILQLMEKNELIRREPVDYDGRLKKIVLTEKAIQIIQTITGNFAKLEALAAQGLTQAELDNFFSTIEKIIHNIS